MSLIAPLLGLPGKIRKLRGHNAPKLPLSAKGSAVQSWGTNNQTQAIQNDVPTWGPVEHSHAIEVISQNNALETTTEVCNISGRGAINGVWLLLYTSGTNFNAGDAGTYEYGLEILVDGVDIMPPNWRLSEYLSAYRVFIDSPLGGVRIIQSTIAYADGFTERTLCEFAKSSLVVPFDSSLVVNLIHYESQSALAKAKCWVNAWETE
jgi:hypothetical protein